MLSIRNIVYPETGYKKVRKLTCVHVCLVTKSCPTLCDAVDYSLPDSSVHGILQARILVWVTISISKGPFPCRDRNCVSCVFALQADSLPLSLLGSGSQSRACEIKTAVRISYWCFRPQSGCIVSLLLTNLATNPRTWTAQGPQMETGKPGSVQFCRSVMSDSLDCSTQEFPVHHQLPELAQTHVHPVGDVIQPSHPLSSLSPLAFNLSHHQHLFQWLSSSHQVAKVLEIQLQHHSFQWIFRTYFL